MLDRTLVRRIVWRDAADLDQAIDSLSEWATDPKTAKFICDMSDRLAHAAEKLNALREVANKTFVTRGPIE